MDTCFQMGRVSNLALIKVRNLQVPSIIPDRIPLSPEIPGQGSFQLKGFFAGTNRCDVVIQAGAQVHPVFPNHGRGEVRPFRISVSGFVLLKTLPGRFAGHAYIQTLEHPVELGVRLPEPSVFGINATGQFNDVNAVLKRGHPMVSIIKKSGFYKDKGNPG